MHDAGGNEHEKQRHMQNVPYGEQSLVDPEFDYLPCDLHPSRDVVERNALESVALPGDCFMTCRCDADSRTHVAAQPRSPIRITERDCQRREQDASRTPLAHVEQPALL